MKLSRDSWLAIGLIAAFTVIGTLAAIQQTQEQAPPPLASFSVEPNGAKALSLWLAELKYAVDETTLDAFALSSDWDVIFMLEPYPGVVDEQWEALDGWIDAGGTLILAGDSVGTFMAAKHYGFELAFLGERVMTTMLQTPLFSSPPLTGPAQIDARAFWKTDRSDFVTHAAAAAQPVIVSWEQGDGRVILSAVPYPFTNAGLKEDGNPELILNMVASGDGGAIWFDEWHHGVRANTVQTNVTGPVNWLRYTAAGRSIVLGAVIIFLALVLNGRRFGRPLPLPKNKMRRAPIEHIAAIANLNRRAGHRTAVLQKYRHWLKRDLGRRYRLNPTLPDDEYVRQIAAYNPNLDKAALRRLLADLNQSEVGESRMVELAAEVAKWLK
ncbi:MAG: DUF4350 domain-containing protein [Chloroflexi bacterium]|nr:DUF4350 domain-containing protein [Chloroflexota bacterium]